MREKITVNFIIIILISLIIAIPTYAETNYLEVNKSKLKIGTYDVIPNFKVEAFGDNEGVLLVNDQDDTIVAVDNDLTKVLGKIKLETDKYNYFFTNDKKKIFKVCKIESIFSGTPNPEFNPELMQTTKLMEMNTSSFDVINEITVPNIFGDVKDYLITDDNKYLIFSCKYNSYSDMLNIIKLYIIDLKNGQVIKNYRLDYLNTEIYSPAENIYINANGNIIFKTKRELVNDLMLLDASTRGYNYFILNPYNDSLEKSNSKNPIYELYNEKEDEIMYKYGGFLYFDYISSISKKLIYSINQSMYSTAKNLYIKNSNTIVNFQSRVIIYWDKKLGKIIKTVKGPLNSAPLNTISNNNLQVLKYHGVLNPNRTETDYSLPAKDNNSDLKIYDMSRNRVLQIVNVYSNVASDIYIHPYSKKNNSLISISYSKSPKLAIVKCDKAINLDYQTRIKNQYLKDMRYYKVPDESETINLSNLSEYLIDNTYFSKFEDVGSIEIIGKPYDLYNKESLNIFSQNYSLIEEYFKSNPNIREVIVSVSPSNNQDVDIFSMFPYAKVMVILSSNLSDIVGESKIEKLTIYDDSVRKVDLPNLRSIYLQYMDFNETSLDLSALSKLKYLYSNGSTFKKPILLPKDSWINNILIMGKGAYTPTGYTPFYFNLTSLIGIKGADYVEIYSKNVNYKDSILKLKNIKILDIPVIDYEEYEKLRTQLKSHNIELWTNPYIREYKEF